MSSYKVHGSVRKCISDMQKARDRSTVYCRREEINLIFRNFSIFFFFFKFKPFFSRSRKQPLFWVTFFTAEVSVLEANIGWNLFPYFLISCVTVSYNVWQGAPCVTWFVRHQFVDVSTVLFSLAPCMKWRGDHRVVGECSISERGIKGSGV